jgi:hypothetical protein
MLAARRPGIDRAGTRTWRTAGTESGYGQHDPLRREVGFDRVLRPTVTLLPDD